MGRGRHTKLRVLVQMYASGVGHGYPLASACGPGRPA